jgi:hypothetical protein
LLIVKLEELGSGRNITDGGIAKKLLSGLANSLKTSALFLHSENMQHFMTINAFPLHTSGPLPKGCKPQILGLSRWECIAIFMALYDHAIIARLIGCSSQIKSFSCVYLDFVTFVLKSEYKKRFV